MSLQDKLLEDTKEAMRNRDKVRRSVLNFLRSAIHNEEIRKQSQLKDQDVIDKANELGLVMAFTKTRHFYH